MDNKKISALSSASALAGTEAIPAVQSATNVKVTPAQIATYVRSTLNGTASNFRLKDGTELQLLDTATGLWCSITLVNGTLTVGTPES